jgi:hypothetical protein
MTDLLFQDIKNLSNKKLVPVLLNERRKMFNEQEPDLKKTKDTRLFLGSLAGLIIRHINSRRETCQKLKS